MRLAKAVASERFNHLPDSVSHPAAYSASAATLIKAVSVVGQLFFTLFGQNLAQGVRIRRIETSLLHQTVGGRLHLVFEPRHEFDFGLAIPEGFVFSPDGRYLFGSSFYTGVSNIFRYELETGELEAVSNAEVGLFRPIPIDNEELIVFRYTGAGLKPAKITATPLEDVSAISLLGTQIVNKYPQLKEWRTDPADEVPAESRIIKQGPYEPIKEMSLESVHPSILGYKDSVSLGLKMNFTDPIRLRMLNIGAAYSIDGDLPTDERPNFQIDYRHAVIQNSPLSGSWRLGASLNRADFYDLFGPTKQSRKGYRYYVGYEKTLIYDEPRRLEFETELNHLGQLLPHVANYPLPGG